MTPIFIVFCARAIEIIKAIEHYNTLTTLEKNIEDLVTEKRELESRKQELTHQLKEHRVRVQELQNTAKNLLTTFTDELNKNAESLRLHFAKALVP